MESSGLTTAVLILGMGSAAVVDLRTRRIPNALTGSLATCGVGLAALGVGDIGMRAALLGVLVGTICMLPGHLFGATGAGDVKLLAAAGALLGPVGILKAFVGTALAGGVLALIVALGRGRLRHTFEGLIRIATPGRQSDPRLAEQGLADRRFAYGPAIAVGVVIAALAW